MSATSSTLDRVAPAARQTLSEITRRFGTPTYAFDVERLRAQAEKLRTFLPAEVGIYYSLKANASLGVCDVFADCGLGADVASAGELATAVAAGFAASRIFVAGPFKLPETIAQLHDLPDAVVSVDSPSELRWLAEQGVANPLVLRLRPDFGSEAVVAAGKESRFGFTADDLVRTREMVASLRLNVVGFHVFAGSQVLHAEGVISHLRASLELSLCAADVLDIEPLMFNLGGGFGIPYGRDDPQLDLEPIGRDLQRLLDRASPARIVLELGRFLVAEAGWYLTTVVGSQTNQGRLAVIVDGGTHQRADMCGLCLRTRAQSPIVLSGARGEPAPTDVLGCLSLPADVLAEASPLPALDPGTVLAFQNAGAYGLWSSPALFHGSPLPAEVAFDGERICLMRERQSIQSIVDQQQHVVRVGFSRDSQRSAEERGNEETSGRVAVQ